MQEITILKEPSAEFPFVLVDKPAGISSAPLHSDDSDSAFSQAAALFPSILAVAGRKPVEHGLIHRLDKDTAGLLLIAATQEGYDGLQQEQAAGRFWKTYRAGCSIISENAALLGGFPPRRPLPPEWNAAPGSAWEVQSHFRNFGAGSKAVRPVAGDSGMAARKKMCIASLSDGLAVVSCRISSGYRHQVRCHLAWCGLPVAGDRLYNAAEQHEGRKEQQLHFFATELSFLNPATHERVHFIRDSLLHIEKKYK